MKALIAQIPQFHRARGVPGTLHFLEAREARSHAAFEVLINPLQI